MEEPITKQMVRNLTKPTNQFLCPLVANEKYKIQFLTFKIETREDDKKNNRTIFEVVREAEKDSDLIFDDSLFEPEELEEIRTIRYRFGPDFLNLKTIETLLEFKIGDEHNVNGFTIIERFYFKDKLLDSFEFKCPFCLKGTTNTWNKVYNFPKIDEETKKQMIAEPWATTSDTFYFAGEEFIMHNKALYSYSPDQDL